MGNLVASASLYFSVARERDTGIQQEHIGITMFIFLINRECRILNKCLVVRDKQRNASENSQMNKWTKLCCCHFCSVWQSGDVFCLFFFFFSPGPDCFTTLLRTSVAVNHLQGCFQINPLWSPGSAVGKLSCCSRVLRNHNPSASLGQSSLMKSQYLDGTVPRICKHAA